MAIRIVDRYPLRVDPASADYPHGKGRNKSAPDAVDGTPFEKDLFNDKQAFFQGMVEAAEITPNGIVDTVPESQYMEALTRLHSGFVEVDVAGDQDVTIDFNQARVAGLKLTGALAGNIDLVVPNAERVYNIVNNTTGGFTVTIKTELGTGVESTASAGVQVVRCDGTNVVIGSPLASSATGEGSDLVAYTGTEETVTEALGKRTIYVGSVAELGGLSLPDGVSVYLTESGRQGNGTIKSGSHPSDPYSGLYIDLANGNYWERDISDGVVYLSWFGPDTTGATEQEALIQSAVNLTPDYYTLSQEGLEGTILVDVPAGQATPRPRAVYIDHPMTLLGSPGVVTKIKDFCSAWVTFDGTPCAYQAESSDAKIIGVHVDANADNHYETDGEGDKYWETGPEGKRPPDGIRAYCPDGAANLTGVILDGNDVYRPLQGVVALGSLGGDSALPLNEPTFLDGTLTTNLIDGVIIRNNVTRRCRGNDVNMSNGVINGEAYGNKSYNSMYHQVRFYTSTINCHAWDNHAYVDYDYLATGYNQTDLWYWRTDDAADGQYLIRRSGMRAGSGFTSVINCSITDNVIEYQSNNPSSSIIDADSVDGASFQTNVSAVKNIQVKNNKSYRSPFGGLFGLALASADDGKDTEGVVFAGNEIYECFGRQVFFQGNNFTTHDNSFEDCTPLIISGGVVRIRGNGIRYFKNHHRFNRDGLSSNNTLFEITSQTASGEDELFVSDSVVEGYTGTYYTQSDAGVLVHGTDVGIKPALENGWTASGGDIILYLNCAGQVSVGGVLNGSAATSDTVLTLPGGYGSKENTNVNSAAIQTADTGDGIAIGETFPLRVSLASLFLNRNGTNASRAGFMLSYQADGRLFS